MSNTRKLGVWAGRTMPAFRNGSPRGPRQVTPQQLPAWRPPDAPLRIRFPAALRHGLPRTRGDR